MDYAKVVGHCEECGDELTTNDNYIEFEGHKFCCVVDMGYWMIKHGYATKNQV